MTDEPTTTPEPVQEPDIPEVPSEPTPTVADTGTPEEPNWLPARLERAKRKAISDFLSGHGLESTDAFEGKLQEAEAARQAKLTESERQQEQLGEMTTQLDAKDAEIAKLQAQLDAGRIDKSITDAVIEAGIRRPSDALDWSNGSGAEIRAGVLDDDGAIAKDGVQAFVDSLKDARPDWFGNRQQAGSVSNDNALPPDLQKPSKEAAQRHKSSGRRAFN